MRCTACGRPIFNAPAATINSRSGPLAFGPKCARAAGLTVRAATKRIRQLSPPVRRARATNQLDLFNAQQHEEPQDAIA